MSGRFIVLDGADGCGKSTQARLLADMLVDRGLSVLLTREPGATSVGRQIRRMLLDPATGDLHPMAEAMLFCADRVQHVCEVLRPALERGQVVVCDRYASSTAVYQGYAAGLGWSTMHQLNDMATGGLQPDLLIVLDTPGPHAARAQQHASPDPDGRGGPDRIEQNAETYHRRVRLGFIQYARMLGDRAVVVDGTHSIEQVHAEILTHVERVLQR